MKDGMCCRGWKRVSQRGSARCVTASAARSASFWSDLGVSNQTGAAWMTAARTLPGRIAARLLPGRVRCSPLVLLREWMLSALRHRDGAIGGA